MWTNQTAYEAIREYIDVIEKPSISINEGPNSSGPLCRYRSEDGNRCFIGMLIPDSEWDARFDLNGELKYVIEHCKPLSRLDLELMRSFQNVHDSQADSEIFSSKQRVFMKARLDQIAKNWKLEVKVGHYDVVSKETSGSARD